MTCAMTNNSPHLRQAIENLNLPDLEWAGFREVRESSTVRYVRDGKPQANETTVTHGVMAEVLVDGQFAYASTQRLDPESLIAAASQAHQQARKTASHRVHRFTAAERPAVKTRYATPVRKSFEQLSPGELSGLLVRISERLKCSPKIVRTAAMAETVRAETRFVSTSGADATQDLCFVTAEFEATAQDGDVVQRRTNGGMRGNCRQGGWENFGDTPELWAQVDLVAAQALELVAAEQCPTETTSLVLMPDQMMLQIHESIGHPLELDRILGDERNYAGWSFVKLEDFGRLQYGSPLMNVTFDPTVPEELASYAFDDCGNPARREFLIHGRRAQARARRARKPGALGHPGRRQFARLVVEPRADRPHGQYQSGAGQPLVQGHHRVGRARRAHGVQPLLVDRRFPQ